MLDKHSMIAIWLLVAACASRPSSPGSIASTSSSPARSEHRQPSSSPELDVCELSMESGPDRWIIANGERAWCAIVQRNAAALAACYSDLVASVSACRGRSLTGHTRDQPVEISLQIAERASRTSKSAPILEAFPVGESPRDKCADDYERADDMSVCVEQTLSDRLETAPATALRLHFQQHPPTMGTIGRGRI